jgi:hypothetical protein
MDPGVLYDEKTSGRKSCETVRLSLSSKKFSNLNLQQKTLKNH